MPGGVGGGKPQGFPLSRFQQMVFGDTAIYFEDNRLAGEHGREMNNLSARREGARNRSVQAGT